LRMCDSLVEPRGRREAEAIGSIASSLGISIVFVEARGVDRAREYARLMRREGVEAYTRITLEADSWSDVVGYVGKAASLYDIVAVRPRGAEAARLAARDPRVAIVHLTPRMARYMDRSQSLMLREGSSYAEVKLKPLLRGGDPRRALRGFMIIARRAAVYEAPLVVGSGARDSWELWAPASMAALLVSVGVPTTLAKLTVSGNCDRIVELYAQRQQA